MPRLPSLGTLVTDALSTARRFPFPLVAALLAALSATLTAEDLGPEALQLRLLAAATLAIPLCTALAAFAEGAAWRPARRLAFQALGLLVCGGFFAAWPDWSETLRETRFWQLMAAFALATAALPFLRRERPVVFWQYNAALLLRAAAAAASAATLFAGLALALLALDKLFGVDVPGEGYGRLWFAIAFVFSTWFFLAGVPKDLDALERSPHYPAIVKVFAQYILVPLVAMYLVILTLYFAKVVVTWSWPSGWIGWLVSGVSVAGIFAILLVHPIADEPEQKWVGVFARDFWLGILPAVLMLWLALYQRIAQYGFTERRWFLLALSVWLGAAALYFGITRSKRIRLIPTSLGLLALLGYAGPWSAYAVARRSQVSRLETLLRRNGLLEAAGRRQPGRVVSGADAGEINAAVRYLVTVHGADALRGLLGDSVARRLRLEGAVARQGGESQVRAIVGVFGVAYALEWAHGAEGGRFNFRARERGPVPVRDFDFLVPLRLARDTADAVRDTALAAVVIRDDHVVRIQRGADVLLELPLDSIVARAGRQLGRRIEVAPGVLFGTAANARVTTTVYLTSLTGQNTKAHPAVQGVEGHALVRTK